MPGDANAAKPWKPSGVTPLTAPGEQPTQDLRWRPARYPAEVPKEPQARSLKAIEEQCTNARFPGYTGYIPSARAEDVYGRTQAAVGRVAANEQIRRQAERAAKAAAAVEEAQASMAELETTQKPAVISSIAAPEEHPLGKSKANLLRNYWVPTVPGYCGFVPGKGSENICGGGIIHTCKLAGRAIAERAPMPSPLPSVSLEDQLARSRVVDHFQSLNRGDGVEGGFTEEREKLAKDIREHLTKQIPGYMGYVPRVKAESIFGTTFRRTNESAAEYCEERILHPDVQSMRFTAPQVPQKRIRM